MGSRKQLRIERLTLIAMAVALTTAGCSTVLAPRPDPTHFFILSAVNPSGANAPSANNLVIGLGPITFPDYLSRAEMVRRMSDDRVEISSTDRWAEPLDVSFKRVFAHDLSTALGGAQVVVFPSLGEPPRFNYRVEMTIDRFDTDAQSNARLDARWTITEGSTGRAVDSSTSTLNVPAAAGGSVTAAVGALNQAASQFAGQLAAALVRLQSPA
jgi:hypothetical protein